MSETPRAKPSPGKLSGARQARSRRRRLLGMCLCVGCAGVSIAAASVLALEFGSTAGRVAAGAAAPGQPANTTASILIHPDGEPCQSRTFDNLTGRIWQTGAPCPETSVDANGVPVPSGTIHTIDSISRSFK